MICNYSRINDEKYKDAPQFNFRIIFSHFFLQFYNKMEAPKKTPPFIPRANSKPFIKRKQQDNNYLKGTLSNKDLRLRQNYIVSKDVSYTCVQGQFSKLATQPQFLRFISPKKNSYPRNDIIAKEIMKHHQQIKRQPKEKNRLRQRILFQKMRRPDYNSPIKKTIKIRDSDTESTHNQTEQVQPQEKKHHHKHKQHYQTQKKNRCESDEENSMMIKQLVTHMDESKKTRVKSFTSYNTHGPTKNQYYVTQALNQYLDKESAIRDHLFNSIFFLELLEKYNNTTQYAEDKPIYMPQNPKFKGKITVVLDLDETLVHCFEELSEKHEVEIPVTFPGGHSMLAPVNIRPHAQQFLEELSKQFELMVFTASHQAYANAVINYLDPKKQFIRHRLFRRHCDYIDEGYYVKDLRILDRDLSRVVLVDNAAYSYAFQVANGIPITSYYEGENDTALVGLKQYLLSLKTYKDVRECNQQVFKLRKYTKFTTVEELVEEVYMSNAS